MKKLALVAMPLAFALTACGGTAEEEAEDVAEAKVEAAGDVIDEQAEALEAQADEMEDAGDEAGAEAVEAEAEALEDQADGM